MTTIWQHCQQSQARSLLFASTVLDLPLGFAKLVSFCYKFNFLCLVAALKGKAYSEDRKAINMENLKLTQDFRCLQNEKPISGLLSVQSAPQYVCILVLQHQGKWMHRCTRVHIFEDAKNVCPNLILHFPSNV